MEKRLIDADVLIAHIKDEIEECKPPYCGRANGKSIAYGTVLGLKSAIAFIEALATIEAEPVVHGEWVPIPEYENKRCSVCRTVFSDFTLGYYCPNCGASMTRGKTDE